MQIAIATLLLLALFFLLHHEPTGKKITWKALSGCDWIGIVLFLSGSVACLVPINVGGSIVPWNSTLVISCLVGGVSALVVLGLHQRFLAKNPAFPRKLFSKGVTNAAFLGSLAGGMLLSMVFYNLVLFWEGVRHLSTVKVGVMLLSVTLTYTFFAAVTGLVIKARGKIRWASIAGTFFAVVGLGMMSLLDDNISVGPIIVINMVAATGCGIMVPAVINTVLASTDRNWHAHAIAMRTLLYTAGQCIGVSIGLAIFTNKFRYHVARVEGDGKFEGTPQSLMTVLKDLSPDNKAIKPMVYALHWVWGAGCILAFWTGGFLCSFKCPPLPKDQATGSEKRQDEMEMGQRRTPSSVENVNAPVVDGSPVRILPSRRVSILRVPTFENPHGSRTAMRAASYHAWSAGELEKGRRENVDQRPKTW